MSKTGTKAHPPKNPTTSVSSSQKRSHDLIQLSHREKLSFSYIQLLSVDVLARCRVCVSSGLSSSMNEYESMEKFVSNLLKTTF